MDKRETFADLEELKNILEPCIEEKRHSDFLIDQRGITRFSGTIKKIEDDNCIFHNGDTIKLKDIIAVNGIFQADYSEC